MAGRSAAGAGRARGAQRAAAAAPAIVRGGARPKRAFAHAAGAVGGGSVAEIQRARLLAAAVGAIEEHGYARTSVADITSRARVSRRTFYELFVNREACVAALIEDVAARVQGEIDAALPQERSWQGRVRGGLWAILCFCDREPELARVCVVQAQRGGPEVMQARERILARLAGALDEGRVHGGRGGAATPLTAEALVGAAHGVVHARLARREAAPLAGLLNELMGMIVMQYLGAAAARREQQRSAPANAGGERGRPVGAPPDRDPLQGVPMRLTYRTARVLACVAECPLASNRVVAEHADIQDQGQVSKLLARLQRLGLVVNDGHGHAKGEPNAWRLTSLGERVTHSIGAYDTNSTAGRAPAANRGVVPSALEEMV